MSAFANRRHRLRRAAAVLAAALLTLGLATLAALRPLPSTLDPAALDTARSRVVDRSGTPLTVQYLDAWNLTDRLQPGQAPALLVAALITAEDHRYWQHGGVDWRARAAAVVQALRTGRVVRGASTITEQVVRLVQPRPRTVWSRWVEGFEARRLEARFTKAEILAFYLDQVPYGSHRRGVRQAALHLFGREPATLNPSEMLALAVLPRAPSRLDPRRHPGRLAGPMRRLAERLAQDGVIAAEAIAAHAKPPPVWLGGVESGIAAPHAVAEARRRAGPPSEAGAMLRTTLAAPLQRDGQRLLDARVEALAALGVRDGALIVLERPRNEIRVWAVADPAAAVAASERDGGTGIGIDAVRTPRQPGSTLKPFLYALALERGWTAATTILDDPIAAHVGTGLHRYRNYSRRHYGPVTLRESLGSSLNVPAVKTLQFVGGAAFLDRLRLLGMTGLDRHPDVYGDGLALGNGEVSLLALADAYATLAGGGLRRAPSLLADGRDATPPTRVFSPDVAAIIADILADPAARRLEFGDGGLLRFPGRTAVKTGTSSDYRDAWCLAFDGHWIVGAWLGTLDGRVMDGVTGSIGPALLVRSVLARLARERPPVPIMTSARLVGADVRMPDGSQRREWFVPGTEPDPAAETGAAMAVWEGRPLAAPALLQPFDGLQLAVDPRVPAALQAFEFRLAAVRDDEPVRWFVDDRLHATAVGPVLEWPLQRGTYRVRAEAADGRWRTDTVAFRVK